MLIIGLTGSIAMGKSTVATLFEKQGVPIISADAIVHELYRGKAVPLIEAAFPGSTQNGEVDRPKLMQKLTAKPTHFKTLEALIHPLVRREEWQFIHHQKQAGAALAIIEIPLLFETGAETLMDAVVLVTAPLEIQKQRALARPNMSEEKFNSLVSKQMPDKEKRKKTDYIIDTNKSLIETETDVKALLKTLTNQLTPSAYKIWENQQAVLSKSP